MKKVWKFESSLGGGKEQMVLIGVTFFWGRRSKLMYYLIFFALDKSYVNFFKLAYHDPRPYMINSNIAPISCSRAFGNPSGHSSSSLILPIVLFLDIFHGRTYKAHKPEFYSTPPYVLSLFLALFWPCTIPFTRYVLGVHSLDQILFGVTLGLWGGLTCHFVIRDHIINHVEESFRHQGLIESEALPDRSVPYVNPGGASGSKVNEINEQSLDTSQSIADPNGVPGGNAEM
jgi:membrane-associated phospholipid phosphatase